MAVRGWDYGAYRSFLREFLPSYVLYQWSNKFPKMSNLIYDTNKYQFSLPKYQSNKFLFPPSYAPSEEDDSSNFVVVPLAEQYPYPYDQEKPGLLPSSDTATEDTVKTMGPERTSYTPIRHVSTDSDSDEHSNLEVDEAATLMPGHSSLSLSPSPDKKRPVSASQD